MIDALGWLYYDIGLNGVEFESSMVVSSTSSINSNVELLGGEGSNVFSFG